jgi:CheY-like chemotaxis protein
LTGNLFQGDTMHPSPKIVVIDDLPPSAALYQDICIEAGFSDVCCFCDPVQALTEMKSRSKPDLIITDNNMPEMKGTEVLRELEAHFGEINAVVVTSDPEKVKFTGKEYPIVEKEIGSQLRLMEFLERNLKVRR